MSNRIFGIPDNSLYHQRTTWQRQIASLLLFSVVFVVKLVLIEEKNKDTQTKRRNSYVVSFWWVRWWCLCVCLFLHQWIVSEIVRSLR